jgi:hypothetical protein
LLGTPPPSSSPTFAQGSSLRGFELTLVSRVRAI